MMLNTSKLRCNEQGADLRCVATKIGTLSRSDYLLGGATDSSSRQLTPRASTS